MKTTLLKHWKTNTIAVISLIVVGLYITDYIDTEQLAAIQGFLIATGLIVSKDSDKP